jgi:hypothetical protein
MKCDNHALSDNVMSVHMDYFHYWKHAYLVQSAAKSMHHRFAELLFAAVVSSISQILNQVWGVNAAIISNF